MIKVHVKMVDLHDLCNIPEHAQAITAAFVSSRHATKTRGQKNVL